MKAYVSTTRPLELIHLDLFGPTTYKSLGGNLYCLVIVDDYSRYTWTFFLEAKTFDMFKKFATMAEKEFGSSMVKIRSENGSEFRNTRVEEYCDGEGIKHEFSSSYTPQQNGVVERKNKTLITLARAMLHDYGVSQSFWAEAVNTACHASNRVYLHRLLMKTPYVLLIGRKPNISYFRVFGCKCFIFKQRKHLGKFESRVDEGILVGYSSNSKAYRVFNNSTRVIEETCDVEFDESNGSRGDGFCCNDVGKEPLREAMKKMAISDIKPKEDDDFYSIHENSSSDDDDNDDQPRRPTSSPTRQDSPFSSQEPPPISQDTQDQVEETEEVQSQNYPTSTTFGRRTRTSTNHPIDLVLGDSKGGTRTRRKQYASFCKHHDFVSFVEHTTIDEALREPYWILAMQDDLNNFTRNKVWELEEHPKNKNVIGTKWVYRNKQD
jgi:hypothetical protein